MDVRRLFSGLNTIAIGLILLANTLGYLPWSVWWNILSLWPLLLVAAGLDILGKSFEWQWMRAVSGAVVLGGLAFGALAMPATGATIPGVWSIGSTQGAPFEQNLPRTSDSSAPTATLSISEGASDLTISRAQPGLLASMSGRSPLPVPRMTWVRRDGAGTAIDISRPAGTGPVVGGSTMQVGMDSATRWDLAVSAGASNVKADLRDIAVEKLHLSTGAASVATTLGALANCAVDVSAGASSVTIRVPETARVRVVSDSALVAADLPGFERVSGVGFGETVWTYAPAGGASKADITIDVSMGAGSLKVSTYAPMPGASLVF
jgi:hypothetical protein